MLTWWSNWCVEQVRVRKAGLRRREGGSLLCAAACPHCMELACAAAQWGAGASSAPMGAWHRLGSQGEVSMRIGLLCTWGYPQWASLGFGWQILFRQDFQSWFFGFVLMWLLVSMAGDSVGNGTANHSICTGLVVFVPFRKKLLLLLNP